MLEIENPEKATDAFIELMIEERTDPSQISKVITKCYNAYISKFGNK